MKKGLTIKLAAFIFLFIIFQSCSKRSSSEQTVSVPIVKTFQVKRGIILSKFSTVGTIQAIKEVLLSSKLNGYIEKIHFEEGDSIKKWETIVEIENIDLALQVKEAESALEIAKSTKKKMDNLSRQQEVAVAKAELARARADLEQVKSYWDRLKNLFERKAVSKQQYDLAERQYKIAKAHYNASVEKLSLIKAGARIEDKRAATASVKQAEARLALAKKRFKDSFIKSPIDGKIATKYVELGELVSYGAPIVRVVDISSVKIEVRISQNMISKIQIGMDVEITSEALADRKFHGKVSNIGITADPQDRTFLVEITVMNDRELLKPGITAQISIIKERFDNVLAIPKDAIIEEYGVEFLYVVKDGNAQKRVVKLGITERDRVIVEKGIELNENIVTIGKEKLVDGALVKIEKSIDVTQRRQ